jgi:hypothetical protein
MGSASAGSRIARRFNRSLLGLAVEPATKQDIKDAIDELKLYLVDRESAWIKWVLGIQITYFVITITVAFIAAHIK